jgi:AcrR family transcriptional regulator
MDGLSGLSTRRVAANLGVTSPALCYRLATMHDILAGVVREAVGFN